MTEPNDKLRNKLTTAAAKEAFDRVSALGANWTFIEKGYDDKDYAAPTIETKKIGGGLLNGGIGGWAKTLDDAVISSENTLIAKASQENTLVVVNAYRDDRAEFTYNNKSKKFTPYKKPAV